MDHQQMHHILYAGLIGGVSSGLVGGGQRRKQKQQQKHQPSFSSMMDYTAYDVLNGRGQGVQRHPGNINYRTLVFVNKVSACIIHTLVCRPARWL